MADRRSSLGRTMGESMHLKIENQEMQDRAVVTNILPTSYEAHSTKHNNNRTGKAKLMELTNNNIWELI